ncbi:MULTISPECIES: thiol-disulfide oxidoreductase DCC family protein [Gracilibacillus]|uniref:thiol-disulfide oxidoreductase DCC family protein n=1 Tax=Gracilibacillus TaxID=74385 RepID=UPI000826DAD9|nr:MULTISPECIES: thiol-disulfide oxidoreductase DCC family protein [Gracilibacillus]
MKKIILFDGVCNFCNGSVQFVIKRDPKVKFQFASLQSQVGKQLVEQYQISADLDSLILIEGDDYYQQSTAALKIVSSLYRLYPLLTVFRLIPRFLRDPIYRMIANNRYRWFGKSEHCMIPKPEDKDRFIE